MKEDDLPAAGEEYDPQGKLARHTPDLKQRVNSEENEKVWKNVYIEVVSVTDVSQISYLQNIKESTS